MPSACHKPKEESHDDSTTATALERHSGDRHAATVGLSAYALTAANVVPATNAGDGAGAITGYTISAVAYTLNGTNPKNLDQAAFTIAPTGAGTVKIRLVAGGAVWYDCVNAAGSVTCDTTVGTQATVLASDELTVLATD